MIDTGAIASEVSHPPPIDSTFKHDPQLFVHATAVNQRSHLDNVVRYLCYFVIDCSGAAKSQN